MSLPFTVNAERFSPYATYRFHVYFGDSTTPVAGVSKVTGFKRSSDVIEWKEAGNTVIRKGLGRTKYDPITIEMGVTHSEEMKTWADMAQVLDKGSASSSLAGLRRQVRIELLNEAGQPAKRFILHRAWVSEYQALSDLDAGGNAVGIELIKIEHEGWEQDMSLAEPAQA